MAPSHDDIFGTRQQRNEFAIFPGYRFKVMREQVMLISSTSNDKFMSCSASLKCGVKKETFFPS
ncbi:hypothetical protein M514_06885 [Trichuris suis]|uniref:Uncharacterized protein n=1 Tax=Trichuris suis TaxID=68888 RepID=A0A085NLP1_9BILA|nr:hypothetical protein M514_06885 [Trichuris suis]